MIVEIRHKPTFQGVCHRCQQGYYYPAGDVVAQPEDSRRLQCAVCGYKPEQKGVTK